MAYGTNAPFGLKPIETMTSAVYNGKYTTYLIKSGYTNNIGTGDPVLVAGAQDAGNKYTGYIISIYDAGGGQGAAIATTPTVGIFQGCGYTQPISQNAVDPASQSRPMWPANQVTVNNVPATCKVADDSSLLFNVQVISANVLTQENMGAGATFTLLDAPVGPNFIVPVQQDGTSTFGIGTISRATPQQNVQLYGMLGSPPNPPTANPSAPGGNLYPNVKVLIQLHQYASRAPIRT